MQKTTILVLIILTLAIATSSAQTPTLVVQSGHGDVINKIVYTPDGKHLITCSNDLTIKVWEVASGKEMRTLMGHSKPVNEIAISPDGSTLVSVSDDRKIIVWDWKAGKILKEIKEHKNKVLCVDYAATGEYFATGSKDKTVRLYHTKTWKGKELYQFKSEVNKVRFMKEGKHLYTETDALLSKNAFFTIPQGKMVTWVPGGGATSVDFDNENKRFLAGRNFGQPSVNIITDWRKIKDWRKNKEPLWKSLIPYNFQDTTGNFQILKTKGKENYDFTNSKVKEGGTVASDYPVTAFFSKDEHQDVVAGNHLGDLLFWRYDDIKFFPRTVNPYAKLNQKIGNMYVTPYKVIDAHNSPILDVVSSQDGKYMITSAENGELKLWDVENEVNLQTFSNGRIKAINSVAFDPGGTKALISAGLNRHYLIDLSTMDILEKFDLEESFERFTLDENQNRALVAFYNSSYFHLMDWKSKKILRTFKGHLGEINSLSFAKEGSVGISTATEGKKITWNLETGEKIASETTGSDPLRSEKNNSKITYLKMSAKLTTPEGSKELPHLNRVTSYGFTPDEKFVFTASAGGSLNFWDPQTGDWQVKLMITADEELIGINSDYYFMASPAALSGLAFRYDHKMYPFEQFDLKYNRPDLFLTTLGYADEDLLEAFKKAYEKRKRQAGNQLTLSEIFKAPEIALDYSQLPRSTDQRRFTFNISARSGSAELDKFIVRINGVPAEAVKLSGKEVLKDVTIVLSEGSNTVEVRAEDQNGVKSLDKIFEITYLPSTAVEKDLYLITIGVSDYREDGFDLAYAAKDARDVAEVIREQSSRFRKIHHINLENDQVTPENVRGLASQLQQADVDDRVIFFFAGHGLLSADLDYYLAAHGTSFAKPEDGGIPYSMIEKLLAASPARNKLVMIDACHSGEVDKESVEEAEEADPIEGELVFRGFPAGNRRLGMNNTFQLMKSTFADLRDNTGTIVISSAGGAEYALESDRWSNGVFTFYLKQGLMEMKADLNGDGRIYASELQQYVADQVSLATGGKQQPTMRVKNLRNDMLIWK